MRRSAGFMALAILLVLVSLGAASQMWAQVTASSSSVTFGSVAVGVPTGNTQTLSFTISGVTLGGVAAVTQGAANLDYTITGGTCASGSVANCTVAVQFLPTAAGTRLGAVVLTDQSTPPITLIAVPLIGIGTGPVVAFGPGTITTIAGPGTGAGLNLPNGIGLDGAGNLYVADTYNQAIRKITPGGVISTIAGGNGAGFSGDGGPATAAQFYYPGPVRADGAGNLYFADYGNNRLRMISPAGIITTVAGGGPVCTQATDSIGDGCPATSATLSQPWGTVSDGAGNLYIGDFGDNVIRMVSPAGIITTVAGGGTGCQQQTDPLGDGCPATSASLNGPQLGAMDSAGNLYITDMNNNVVRMVAPGGIITTVVGKYPSGCGYAGDNLPATLAQICYPQEVAVDAAGNLYITDGGNYPNQGQGYGVIRKVTPGGIISTVAGNGSQGYSSDGGPATSAQMNGPWDIAVDGLGNLYIVDAYNNAIRKVNVSSAPSLTFASTDYNAVSAAQDVTVENLGNASLAFASIVPAPNFTLGGADTNCGSALDPAASCVLGIEFAPMATGVINGSVVLTDNATPAIQTIGLQGTAVPAPQSITFAGPGNQTYGVAPITLTASATSGLPVVFARLSGPATISGPTLTITGSGTVVLQAIQSGNTDWAAALPVTEAITVAQAPLTVTVAPSSYARAVGAANPTFTGTVVGVVNGDVTAGKLTITYSSAAGASSPVGSYPVTATISGSAAASYSLTVNPGTLNVWATGIDLIESGVSVTGTPSSGGTIQVADTASNQGIVNAPATSTWFYLTTSPTAQSGTYLGSRAVPTLAAQGATSSGSTTLTLPSGIAGTYYILACANSASGGPTESNRTNNCSASLAISVAGPDLAESAVSVTGTFTSGGAVQATDTATDSGGTAPASTTYFYLTTSATAQSGTLMGTRSVPTLAAGNLSTATTNLTLPAGLNGTYYVVACANSAYGGFAESNRANNCSGSAAIVVAGPDLAESAVSVTGTLASGGAIQVTDTATDSGGTAPASTTYFYLTTSAAAQSGSYLGGRGVPSLATGISSTATTNLTLPAGLKGTYYIVVCANSGSATFVESNRANNCSGSAAMVITH